MKHFTIHNNIMFIIRSDPGPEVRTEEEEEAIITVAGGTDKTTEIGGGRTGPGTTRAR